LTFLPFFYNFQQISKDLQKKKREKREQCWAQFDRSGPSLGEKREPAPALQALQKGPRRSGLLEVGSFTVALSH
jgi:hypothetical protein